MVIDVTKKNAKRIIKNTRKYIKEDKIKFNFNEEIDSKLHEDLMNIEKAINIKDIEKRFSFIYDKVCDYLDNKYFGENLCGFDENGICDYYREIDPTHYNGCCYRDDRSLCEYFDEEHSKCTERGISCKLYSCPTLRKKNIEYKIKDIPLLKYFFTIKQKFIIKYSFLKPKPYVMYKLMETVNEKDK